MLHKEQWSKENHIKELCKAWYPKRGEVVLVDLGQEGIKGSEFKGLRPAVVLSNNIGNQHSGIITVAPLTSTQGKPNLPVHVKLDQRENLKIPSLVCLEQIKTISKERAFIGGKLIRIAMLSEKKIAEIDNALKIQFGLI